MSNINAKRDDNWQPVVQGETDDVNRETRSLLVDPVTGRLKVDTSVSSSALPTGAATEAKQDVITAKIDSLIEELQDKVTAGDIETLRKLLLIIANPSYVDKSANQMRSQVTGALTSVTTVTNLTNFGSFPADHLQRMDNKVAWATNVRNLII